MILFYISRKMVRSWLIIRELYPGKAIDPAYGILLTG